MFQLLRNLFYTQREVHEETTFEEKIPVDTKQIIFGDSSNRGMTRAEMVAEGIYNEEMVAEGI